MLLFALANTVSAPAVVLELLFALADVATETGRHFVIRWDQLTTNAPMLSSYGDA